MDTQTILLVIYISIPAGLVIFFHLKYIFYCKDLLDYLKNKHPVLAEELYKNEKSYTIVFYGLNYSKTGIFMQFKTLKYLEKQISDDSTVSAKIIKMRKTLYFGLATLFIGFMAIIILFVIKFLLL